MDRYKLLEMQRCGDGANICKIEKVVQQTESLGQLSDGYHTFDELYEFRKLYNAALFNEWFKQGKYNVVKSKNHSDGEPCFGGGWFVVYATTPFGQISNHYEIKDWRLFQCDTVDLAPVWDGHNAEDVKYRLKQTLMLEGE